VPKSESDALTVRAKELLLRYNIDEALLAAKASLHLEPSVEDFEILSPYAVAKIMMFSDIAKSFSCRVVRTQKARGNGGISKGFIFGFPNEIQSTRILYTSLLLQGTEEAQVHSWLGNSNKTEQNAFWQGFSYQIGRLLTETTESFVKNEKPGTQLVLSSRKIEV